MRKLAERLVLAAALAAPLASCGGSLYKVKPKIDASVEGGREASTGAFTIRAAPLLADEESQDLFEANLPLAGLLPVRVEMANSGAAPLSFERVRFRLRDAEGREWKFRTPRQAVSRILESDQVYLYNPNSRRAFEEAVAQHAFDLKAPLEPAGRRRGMVFFQTPKKEQLDDPRGLVLTVEGLPEPVEVIFN
jgi:hypothetical protein